MNSIFTEFRDHFQSANNPDTDKYKAAQDSFWAYCKLLDPKFFKDGRPHLRTTAETLKLCTRGVYASTQPDLLGKYTPSPRSRRFSRAVLMTTSSADSL